MSDCCSWTKAQWRCVRLVKGNILPVWIWIIIWLLFTVLVVSGTHIQFPCCSCSVPPALWSSFVMAVQKNVLRSFLWDGSTILLLRLIWATHTAVAGRSGGHCSCLFVCLGYQHLNFLLRSLKKNLMMKLCIEICLEANRKYIKKIGIWMSWMLSCGTSGNFFLFCYFLLWKILHSTLNASRLKAGGISFFTSYLLASKAIQFSLYSLIVFNPCLLLQFFKVILLYLVVRKDKKSVYLFRPIEGEREWKTKTEGSFSAMRHLFLQWQSNCQLYKWIQINGDSIFRAWPHHKITFYFLWACPS